MAILGQFHDWENFVAVVDSQRDRQAEAGSIIVEVPSPAKPDRKLVMVQRGNTIEVAYRSDKPSDPGPGEMQFVFEEGQQLEGFGSVVEFLKRISLEQTVIVRKKYWISGRTQLRFCSLNDLPSQRRISGRESWLGTYDG